MFWSKRGMAVVFGLTLAIGCGGGTEMASSEPASAPAEAAAPEEAPSAQVMLGGGALTPVHEGAAGSPHVKVDWEVSGANLSVTYGRPYLRDRVGGDSVEPLADKVWRLGADEATTFTTSGDLMVGSVHVPAGDYTLFTLTSGDTTELIVNSETGQWGTAHNEDNDLGRTEMSVSTLNTPADQLTIFIENSELRFEWGAMAASVPIVVH